MLDVEEWADLRRQHFVGGVSIKELSRRSGLARNTIRAAKAAAGEMAIDVTDRAMRIGGGAAYSRHLPLERLFRDARAASVMAPTTDLLYDFIGKAITGQELF